MQNIYLDLDEPELNKLSIAQLPDYFERHGLQRLYTANNAAWTFDILSDRWQVSTKGTVNLEFMNEFDIPMQTWLSLRILIADKAESYKKSTVGTVASAIKSIGNGWQDCLHFQAAFNVLKDGYKRRLISSFRELEKNPLSEFLAIKTHFNPFIRFLQKQDFPNPKRLKGVFDPVHGVYTDEEMQEIQDKIRLTVSELLTQLEKNVVPSLALFLRFTGIIRVLLLISIYRRPAQLEMMKWSDVLPIGVSFKDHRYAAHSPAPEEETGFSDVDQVHLRTFKAKNGYGFRGYAERRSHRMEPEFSKLIGIYRYFYQLLLMDRLTKQGIQLSEEEWEDLLCRCPFLPGAKLFTTQYNTKRRLFASVGHQSDAMHSGSSIASIKRTSRRLGLSSTRIAHFDISNNRSRHTVITNALERGLSVIQSAAITGVTPSVVKNYAHLDIKGRVAINKSMAGHRVLNQFVRISLHELKNYGWRYRYK